MDGQKGPASVSTARIGSIETNGPSFQIIGMSYSSLLVRFPLWGEEREARRAAAGRMTGGKAPYVPYIV